MNRTIMIKGCYKKLKMSFTSLRAECCDGLRENSKNGRMHKDAVEEWFRACAANHWLQVQSPVEMRFSITTEPLSKAFNLR